MWSKADLSFILVSIATAASAQEAGGDSVFQSQAVSIHSHHGIRNHAVTHARLLHSKTASHLVPANGNPPPVTSFKAFSLGGVECDRSQGKASVHWLPSTLRDAVNGKVLASWPDSRKVNTFGPCNVALPLYATPLGSKEFFVNWVYDEKKKEATYCGSSAVYPPNDSQGNPWPCHDVRAPAHLTIKTVTIPGKFSTLKCARMAGAPDLSVTYAEIEPAIRGFAYKLRPHITVKDAKGLQTDMYDVPTCSKPEYKDLPVYEGFVQHGAAVIGYLWNEKKGEAILCGISAVDGAMGKDGVQTMCTPPKSSH